MGADRIPVGVHAGTCWDARKRCTALLTDEARQALAEGVPARPHCRPDVTAGSGQPHFSSAREVTGGEQGSPGVAMGRVEPWAGATPVGGRVGRQRLRGRLAAQAPGARGPGRRRGRRPDDGANAITAEDGATVDRLHAAGGVPGR
ncbi:DUF6233 domain-containing protein [Streptomyces sp. NPDC050448]|uniref:DUF6233 domain-containing protein n=1 Tax=Streptomyces sp. NPDC050448 TaxID=3155404 RepID=UPI00341ED1DF